MKQKLIDVLTSLGFPVYLKNTVLAKDLPEDVILFWQFSSSDNSYDDDDHVTTWGFEISYLSTNPQNVEDNKKLIRKTLKDNGFIADGKGYDLTTDITSTCHTGWQCDFYFMEVIDG